ncbi:hypothetical protein [Fulvivirga lutea]|uniref:T9SS C-terminal target domain-containing protein n=1 Tax=Fulvivirga lutea TaxID=2810512 RepID=A0A974WIL7_9BACT|nr:hypothetical protein [Fulvivirga lutea]QSE96830.1 hypothetical protein JR347_14685 [Fulvivirga lutea]
MIIRIVFILLCLSPLTSKAGELLITGTYQGKDIYVQNPYDKENKKFCTTAVFVNGIKVFDNPSITAFKIDLSGFSKDEQVTIKLEYTGNCTPTIVNPDALVSKGTFQFTNINSDNNSVTWSVVGEVKGGEYYLYHKLANKDFIVYDTIPSRGGDGLISYSRQPIHKQGENVYKVVYNYKSESKESSEVRFTATENFITFYPQIATTSLALSDTTTYAIESFFGKTVKKGEGKEINLTDLKPGKYYLVIQNRKQQFIKR